MEKYHICSAFQKAYQIDDLDFIESDNSLVLFSKEKRMIFEFHCRPEKEDVKKCVDAWLYHRVFIERVKKNSDNVQEVKRVLSKT